MAAPELLPPELLSRLRAAVRTIRFGSIQLIIHDSRIVQIETAEKIRLAAPPHLTPGGPSGSPSRTDPASGGSRPIQDD